MMKTSGKRYSGLIVIIFCLFCGIAKASDQCPPPDQCWTTQDIIDSRIDSHAQTALIGMLTRGGNEGIHASSILCAVKRGELEGIYLPDQKVPALKARRAKSNWWEMIPNGQQSECYKKVTGEKPLMVFSKKIKDNSKEVADALVSAWNKCGIQSQTIETCYVETIRKLRQPPPGKGLLTVVIYNRNDGRGVEGATISIGAGGSKTTGSGGAVEFGPLVPGSYEVSIGTAPGCLRSYSDRAMIPVGISADEHEWVSRGFDCGHP